MQPGIPSQDNIEIIGESHWRMPSASIKIASKKGGTHQILGAKFLPLSRDPCHIQSMFPARHPHRFGCTIWRSATNQIERPWALCRTKQLVPDRVRCSARGAGYLRYSGPHLRSTSPKIGSTSARGAHRPGSRYRTARTLVMTMALGCSDAGSLTCVADVEDAHEDRGQWLL